MLQSRYPDIRKTWVTKQEWSKRRKDVFEAFRKGECEAFVEAEFKLQHKHGIGELCDVELIGRSIHSYGWGYPIRKALLPHVSWGILEAEMKGGFIAVEESYPPPQSKCNREAVDDADLDGRSLETRHLAG